MFDINLAKEIGATIYRKDGCGTIKEGVRNITNVQMNHNYVTNGSIFIALKGKIREGIDFFESAVRNGAVASLIYEKNLDFAKKKLEELSLEKKEFGNVTLIAFSDIMSFLVRYGIEVIRRFKKKKIAVVGAAGKTTLKELLAKMLPRCLYTKRSMNIKFSIASELLILDEEDYDFVVLEFGTDSPGDISELAQAFSPDYAIFSSLGLEHSAFFSSLDQTVREECSILNYVDLAVVGSEKKFMPESVIQNYNNIVEPEWEETETGLIFDGELIQFPLKELKETAAKVLTMCKILDVKPDIQKLEYFSSPCCRGNKIEITNDLGSITILDHSYNSNPVSIENILNNLDKDVIMVLSPMAELGSIEVEQHEILIEKLKNNRFIKTVFLIGKFPLSEESFCNSKFIQYESAAHIDHSLFLGKNVIIKGSKCFGLLDFVCSLIDPNKTKQYKHI